MHENIRCPYAQCEYGLLRTTLGKEMASLEEEDAVQANSIGRFVNSRPVTSGIRVLFSTHVGN